MFLRNFDQDDEFFHITSQIEPSLKQRIEKGEFVELGRLLPKDRGFGSRSSGDDLNKQLFQLITQGTGNYVEPPTPKTGRINSVRNGTKHSEFMRPFTQMQTRVGHLKSGNTSI